MEFELRESEHRAVASLFLEAHVGKGGVALWTPDRPVSLYLL